MATPGGPKLPPQALDIERQTAGATALRPWTRRILYGALALMAIFVVGSLVWMFLAD